MVHRIMGAYSETEEFTAIYLQDYDAEICGAAQDADGNVCRLGEACHTEDRALSR